MVEFDSKMLFLYIQISVEFSFFIVLNVVDDTKRKTIEKISKEFFYVYTITHRL